MKRTELKRKTPMKRSQFRTKPYAARLTVKLPKRMKSKQRAVTHAEQAYWSRLAGEIGCIACRLDGRENPFVSIHHTDGRTKPGCHMRVLPVCAPHHQQDDTDPLDRVAIHPNKAEFELIYGTQERLMEICHEILGIEQNLERE